MARTTTHDAPHPAPVLAFRNPARAPLPPLVTKLMTLAKLRPVAADMVERVVDDLLAQCGVS